MIDVSIIIPVYYNEESINKTIDTIVDVVIIKNSNLIFEIICIDDGSGDASYVYLEQIQLKHPKLIKVLKFTRNFGQVQAILAGYSRASGKCIINVSADMQDPLELMNEMIQTFFYENTDIVIGTRMDRNESYYRKVTSQFFYNIMRKLSFSNMPTGGFDYALLSARVVKSILSNKEANPFWQGQVLWTGYTAKFIPYVRVKREFGKSRWTFGRKIKYLIDGVMGYSFYPLRAIAVIGFVLFVIGILYALFIVGAYFWGEVPFKGWAPIMILILTLFGLVFLMLGIIGEYLWRVLDQVRGRPGYLVEKELND